jgi:hypothetical protein
LDTVDPVSLTGNLSTVDELYVNAAAAVTLTGATLHSGLDIELAHAGARLTLTAAQADLVDSINGETGAQVTVTGLDAAPSANINNIGLGLVVTAELVATAARTLSGDLSRVDTLNISGQHMVTVATAGTLHSGLTITVASGSTLQLTSAALAAGVTSISGAGAVMITGDIAGLDLSMISAHLIISQATGFDDVNDLPNLPVLDANQELSVSPTQALSLMANGELAGTGTVTMQLSNLADAYDFSPLSELTTLLVFAGTGTVNAATVLTGVDQVYVAGATTMTSAQADGVAFWGPGRVTITASEGAQVLKGTAQNDTIWGDTDATTTDTVDISQGGVDTLKFSSAANGMTVTGFTMGAGGDVLDFSEISELYNENYDYQNTAYVEAQSLNGQTAFGGLVVALTSLTSVSSGSDLATALSPVELASGSKMIFLTGADNGANTKIWLWDDAVGSSDGDVAANEVTLLGTLLSVNMSSLATLQDQNVFYPSPA